MNSLTVLFGPLVLLAPAFAPAPAEPDTHTSAAALTFRDTPVQGAPPPVVPFDEMGREPVQHQVSIEQRVIIRIAPSVADPRLRLFGNPPPVAPPEGNLKEARLRGCLPIASIAAITPAQDNRLMILMRDRQLLSATLEKTCNPAEFYSGAYVERNADGKLCPRREQLQSRMGSKCRITAINRLVPKD